MNDCGLGGDLSYFRARGGVRKDRLGRRRRVFGGAGTRNACERRTKTQYGNVIFPTHSFISPRDFLRISGEITAARQAGPANSSPPQRPESLKPGTREVYPLDELPY